MLVQCFLVVLLLCCACCIFGSQKDNASKITIDEDYYINYDYDINNSNNNNINNNDDNKTLVDVNSPSVASSNKFHPDPLILPNPDTLDSKYSVDVLPEIELPDDSLADSDLKDHDFIDNIMYVYYGSGNRNGKHYVSEVIIIGSVLSCAAQLLTLFCVWLKKYYKGRKRIMLHIAANIFGCMFLSNLIFMLGVYATRNQLKCLLVALSLNFLYIHTAIWIFVYCFYIYRTFNGKRIFLYFKLSHLNVVTCGISLIITLGTYFAITNSFETKRYCFVSIHRGMFFSCLPFSGVLALTTVSSINGMVNINEALDELDYDSLTESLKTTKHENKMADTEFMKEADGVSLPENEIESLLETRNCLKSMCTMQLAFDIFWFTTPMALEWGQNNKELLFLQLLSSTILNWYIFFKQKTLLPSMQYTLSSEKVCCSRQSDEDTSVTNLDLSSVASSDNIPLLNSDNATEMKELKRDSNENVNEMQCDSNISTISA